MTQQAALDVILGAPAAHPPQGETVLSSVARLSRVNGAVLAEIERMDERQMSSARDLVRLDETGQARASLRFDSAMSDTEKAIVQVIIGPDDTGLIMAGPTDVLPLSDARHAQASAISALPLRHIDSLLEASNQAVVAGAGEDGEAVLWLVSGAGAAQALPMSTLEIAGWRALSTMSCMDNMLFVAIADPVAGGEVFRFDLSHPGNEPTRLLSQGAQRFALNAAFAGMLPHPNGLLIGTAALAAPRRAVGDWGPELLLLSPEGGWDMIFGQPRFTPSGLILPASGMAPGMGNQANAAIRAMHSDGELTVIALQDYAGAEQEDRRKASPDLAEYGGALRLFASFDLEEWTEIPHDLPRDIGAVTSLFVTETTLFVGHEALGAHALPVSVVPLSG